MRLGTWNCRGDFDRKAVTAMDELAPDVLVVPEGAPSPAIVASGWQYRYQGTGSKGLGVFVRNGWSVEPVEPPNGHERPWFLPLHLCPPGGILPPFLFIGVWTVKGDGRPSYASQFTDLLEIWAEVIREQPTVIAGDLNASAQGPSVKDHTENLALATKLELVSSYHAFHRLVSGEERDMTLQWFGQGKVPYSYHCDFVFVPKTWVPALRSVEVSNWDQWVHSGRSDHAPVMIDVDEVILRSAG